MGDFGEEVPSYLGNQRRQESWVDVENRLVKREYVEKGIQRYRKDQAGKEACY